MDFELKRYAEQTGQRLTMNSEARICFLEFALSDQAVWAGNFRDLNAAVSRMATLAGGRRITRSDVLEEITRLKQTWSYCSVQAEMTPHQTTTWDLPADLSQSLDLFDQAQLKEVLSVCRNSSTMAEAGRRLFSNSRKKLKAPNDSDRIRKYLSKFGLNWRSIQQSQS